MINDWWLMIGEMIDDWWSKERDDQWIYCWNRDGWHGWMTEVGMKFGYFSIKVYLHLIPWFVDNDDGGDGDDNQSKSKS